MQTEQRPIAVQVSENSSCCRRQPFADLTTDLSTVYVSLRVNRKLHDYTLV